MISIVVCSAESEKAGRFRTHAERVFGTDGEIVSIIAPRSLAAGYNEGLSRSSGDPVVFCHDDIEFLGGDVPARIRRHLETFDGIGVAGTDRLIGPNWGGAGLPHVFGQVAHKGPAGGIQVFIYGVTGIAHPGIQALDGLFLAFRREAIEALGWDAETFDGFHLYDVDTTFRAYLAGYRLAVVNDLPILHASPGSYDKVWLEYAKQFSRRFADKLAKGAARRGSIGAVEVRTEAEALEVMSPIWLYRDAT